MNAYFKAKMLMGLLCMIALTGYSQEQGILKELRSETDIDLGIIDFDVSTLIKITSAEEIEKKRAEVTDLLWGNRGFPFEKLPADVDFGISDDDFASLENLEQIDRLTVEMEFGLKSIIYHFIPKEQNGSAAIYHQGHRGKFDKGITTINAFLKRGYDVYGTSMPLLGMNNQPVVYTERFGRMVMYKHILMGFLLPEEGHAVKFFMEPVAATVNYMQEFDYEHTIMIGLSGGGWTTTLYAALDERIETSIPVAGSLPMYLRAIDTEHESTIGDYEQLVPEIYTLANYLELYIMGASGKNRSQLQVLNEFDSCCFEGNGYKSYQDIVKERLKEIGEGRYDVFLDSSHMDHRISENTLKRVFEFLE